MAFARNFVCAWAVGMGAGCAFATEQLILNSEQDRVSYAFGYRMGQFLKEERSEVNPTSFSLGIDDGVNLRPTRIDENEAKHRYFYARKAAEGRLAAIKDRAIREASQTFLAENAKAEKVRVLPSDVQYRVLVEGSGEFPNDKDFVTILYKISRYDGTLVKDTSDGPPLTFSVKKMAKGMIDVVQLMKVGSKFQVFIPYELSDQADEKEFEGMAQVWEVELKAIGGKLIEGR